MNAIETYQLTGALFAFIVFIVLIPLAILALWLASRLFQREVILTRWK